MKKSNKSATVVEVARRAGVSPSTVSRVFDSKWEGKIKDATREAVLAAAKELGYYGTNALARGLVASQTNIIAIVTGKNTGYFYREIIMKFVSKLQENGKQALIFEFDPLEGMDKILTQVHQYRVDAVIITSAATINDIVDTFDHINIPAVIFNRYVKGSSSSAVYCDFNQSARNIADFLMDRGCNSFGVITGNVNTSKEQNRLEGFKEQVLERNGEILEIIDGDYNYESGYQCTCELLLRHRPDAVFCPEDSIALGAIDAVRDSGMRVPEDISVMGFDNSSISALRAYVSCLRYIPI